MTNNTNNRSWAQNQTLFSLGIILKKVDEWKEQNQLQPNKRYSRTQLQDLENKIIGYCVEEKLGLVYMSYHTLWAVLKHIDPSFTYKYEVIDYTNYNLINALASLPIQYTELLQKVLDIVKIDGKSINVSYSTELLPVYTQEIALAITDNKNMAIASPNVDDIEYTKQRAFVKSVAYNTGLGYSCWINPEGVKKLMKQAQAELQQTTTKPKTTPTPTPTPTPIPTPTPTPTPTPIPTPTPTPTQVVDTKPTPPVPPPTAFKAPAASVVTQSIAKPTPTPVVETKPIVEPTPTPTPIPTRSREELIQLIMSSTTQERVAPVQAYLKEKGISNLKDTDVDGLEKLLAFINTLK